LRGRRSSCSEKLFQKDSLVSPSRLSPQERMLIEGKTIILL
jgi:hypothetical protein